MIQLYAILGRHCARIFYPARGIFLFTKTKMGANMKTSNKGINFIKQFEGTVKSGDKHIIYDDETGCPVPSNAPLPRGATIGYGHLIKSGEDFSRGITESQAIEILRSDINMAERAVKDSIIVPLTQNQFDALVSLAYNLGAKKFANSTVVKYVNNPDFTDMTYPTLESAWIAWNKSGGKEMTGLTNRRKAELNLFLSKTI